MAAPSDREETQGEVVCVLRETEGDERALHVAADLARRLDLPLALIGVRAPLPPAGAASVGGPHAIPPEVLAPPDEPLGHDDTAERRERLARLAEEAAVRARVDALVATAGDAAAQLAHAPQTAWLVLADDGAGPLMGKVEGEPARRILRDAPCPIVVVPPESSERVPEHPLIVCGLADAPGTAVVARVAGELAAGLGGRLRFLHAVALLGRLPPIVVQLDDLDAPERERVERVFDDCRRALPSGVDITFECVAGDADAALRAAAAQEGAGLLVVGRPTRGAFMSALLGSVTHDVLEAVRVPLVVAPSSEDAAHGGTGR